jgi:hypothetical protein
MPFVLAIQMCRSALALLTPGILVDAGTWAWVGGTEIRERNGVYGDTGVASASNMPGARRKPTTWVDASTNRTPFFGGSGQDEPGVSGNLNDLWWYNLRPQQLARDGFGQEAAKWQTKEVCTAIWGWPLQPTCRVATVGYASTWVDPSTNRAFLFGGYGHDAPQARRAG